MGGFIIVSWRDAMAVPLRSAGIPLRRDRRWYQRAPRTRESPIAYRAPMELGIAGRSAAVAAASGGLGLGSAKALVADGVDVAICGRDPERLQGAVAELEALGGGAVHGLAGDVSTVEG